jgi:ubiquinone/menaquinone biosynthesis C-methylase UbiE
VDQSKVKKDYVDIVYNQEDRPFTPYPDQLTKYLSDRFGIKQGDSLLDYGCGRGEFTNGFVKCGAKASAIDMSDYITKTYNDIPFKTCDMANEPFPLEENTFDFAYSKSVIEHFYYPEKVMAEVLRVLKPGGTAIVLTPDWEVVYKSFYDDYTHRTPFTKTSLTDFMTIMGFEDVKVEKFIQLPSVWESEVAKKFSQLTALVCPDSLKAKSKWIRFSKEMMLLAVAKKPL